MNVMSYSEVRAHLRKTMVAVCTDHTPTLITSRNGHPVVMLSLADYNSMMETIHLVSSPANAKRLSESIAQHRAGKERQKNGV